ncbi:hypothetical protein Dimus_037392 [Dionaea muscipula]
MDSWKYSSDGKNLLLSEEMDLTVDGLGRSRSKNMGMGWEIKPFPHNDNCYPFVSNTEALESLEFLELGFPDSIRNPYSRDRSGDGLGDGVGVNSYENLGSPTATSDTVCGGKESGSGLRASSYFMELKSEDSPPIDLKLGWLPKSKGPKDGEFPKGSRDATAAAVSSCPTKRGRSRSLHSPTAYCQVYGCNKDLSSSKDYHKRHKVCDVHSKTAKVVVNGIEQRFCQQCSRFHILSEFDDDKRSCRKRLANHNERRRKPQIATHSCTRFLSPSLVKRTSFLFPDMLPGAILSPSKNESEKWMNNYFKYEDSTRISNLLPNMHGGGEKMVNVSSGSRDNMVGIAAHGIEDVYSASDSSRALSLLSTQSHNFSRDDILGATIGSPHLNKSSHDHDDSGLDFGCSAGSLEKFGSSMLHAPETKSMRLDEARCTAMDSYDGHGVNFNVVGGCSLSASDTMKQKYCVSSGPSMITNLFQLSSHLERVEQQRTSMKPMNQNHAFSSFPPSYRE